MREPFKRSPLDFLKWTKLKRVYTSTNLNSLFFATFTTIISVFAFNVIPGASASIKITEWIDFSLLLASLFTFFFSAIVWYCGLLIYEFSVPSDISKHYSDAEYIDRIRISTNGLSNEEEEDFVYRHVKIWYDLNRTLALVRVFIGVSGLLAFLLYAAALVVFLRSISGFLLYLTA